MSGNYDSYNDSDRDRGRSRERRGSYDSRIGGSDRSRSRHSYDEQGRGYQEGNRPRGDSYDRRSHQDRRGYDHQMDRRQERYGRSSSQGHYGAQGNVHGHNQRYHNVDSSYYGSRSHHDRELHQPRGNSGGRGPPQGAGYYGGSHGHNRRHDVDSTYGPGSHHDRELRRHSGVGGPPRGGRYGGGRGRGRGHGSPVRGGRGGGGRVRGPDLSGLQACVTNILKAEVTEGFKFFVYTINAQHSSGEEIESRDRRSSLFNFGFWDGLLKELPRKEKNELRKVVFFNGSTFYSGREIPGLEPSKLPYEMEFGDRGEGDSMEIRGVTKLLAPTELQEGQRPETNQNEIRFDNRTENGRSFETQQALLQYSRQTGNQIAVVPTDGVPASLEVFSAFVNSVLQSALAQKLSRSGRDLLDLNSAQHPTDRRTGKSLGVSVYHAFCCEFSVLKKSEEAAGAKVPEEWENMWAPHLVLKKSEEASCGSKGELALTVNLRAKVLRDKSVLNDLVHGGETGSNQERANANAYHPTPSQMRDKKKDWIGQIVVAKHDMRRYRVVDLDFENSAESLAIENLGINHAEYFQRRKQITLEYPKFKPMVAVLGRRNERIHLPAELVCGHELPQQVKAKLPMIANFEPKVRNAAISQVREFLEPGTRGAQGILPGLGVRIRDERYYSSANVLPLPMVKAAGAKIPEKYENRWAPQLAISNYRVEPKDSNEFNVVLIHFEQLDTKAANAVYCKIRDSVNKLNTLYRFGHKPVHVVPAGQREMHWSAVEKCFANDSNLPRENVFVLDFCNPSRSTDPAYSVIKHMLTKHGYISQFVNFWTCNHDRPSDEKKAKRSRDILNGVGRQILQKAGVRLWWVQIPRGLPTPSVFVGVDVYHAPKEYDPAVGRPVRKPSCAAIIVQVFRSDENGDSDRQSTIELYSETVVREAGKEYDLRESLNGAVKTALKEMNVNPMSCVVWRDGIGDSAFEPEASEEIKGVETALKELSLDETKKTPMAYVVCQKGIDTKLFAAGVPGFQDGTLAAPAGTLVEGLQALQYHTFYINGRAPQGTPKPVRFVVVRKDDELKDLSMPKLTWSMCHDYPNWAGPIKVPSVCMMAHKLAELAGNMADSGENMDHIALKNRVHFL